MFARIKVAFVAVVVVAALFVIIRPSSAAAPTLQVTPEQGRTSQGVQGQKLTAITTDAVNLQVHFEVESGPGEPATGGGTAGNTPQTPDYRCTVGSDNQCSVTIASAATGTALIRAWINVDGTDATVDADNAEGRLADKSLAAGLDGTDCATEGRAGSSAVTACETGVPVPGASAEPDLTDVVDLTFVQAPTVLDCDDSNPGTDTGNVTSDDKESNNFQDGETYKCTAYDPQGTPVAGVRIDGENLSRAGSVNDPDNAAADPADYYTKKNISGDYTETNFCVTEATGSCSNVIPASEAQIGTADICFWLDLDNDYGSGGDASSFASAGSLNDGGGCASEPWDQAEKNNATDVAQLTWDNTTTASTTTTTSAPPPTTTTTAPTATTSTTAPTGTTTTTSTTLSSTTTTAPSSPVRAPQISTGTGPGAGAAVQTFTPAGQPTGNTGFLAFPDGPGVRVARGDVNGNGADEIIVGAGPGGPATLAVWSAGGGLIASTNAYPGFQGGIFVAVGNVDGSGNKEIVTSAGPGGGPHVRTFSLSGNSLSGSGGFFAAPNSFTGGLTVAAADLDNDGKADIIVGRASNDAAIVSTFHYDPATTAASPIDSFVAYGDNANPFVGGVNVAAADLSGDGRAEIVTAPGPGGGPHVKIFTGSGGLANQGVYAYGSEFSGGVNVAVGDLNNDGSPEIVTGAGPGGGPHVKVFNKDLTLFGPSGTGFYAYAPNFTGGVYVSAGKA